MSGLIIDHLLLNYNSNQIPFSFSLDSEEFLILKGPNGSGKTTFLHTIAGLEAPKSGHIIWENHDLLKIKLQKRPITLLLQGHNLFDHLSVSQNLAFAFSPKIYLDFHDKQRIFDILEVFNITHLSSLKVHKLSGGQQQLIAFLRCFLKPRPLLLLDEPFTGLDSDIKTKTIIFLKEKQKKHSLTIILTTHHQEEIKMLRFHFNKIKEYNFDKNQNIL